MPGSRKCCDKHFPPGIGASSPLGWYVGFNLDGKERNNNKIYGHIKVIEVTFKKGEYNIKYEKAPTLNV
jgi:hypothetical protein